MLFFGPRRLVLEADDHGERRLIGAHRSFRIMFVPAQGPEGEFDEFHLEFLLRVVGDRKEFLEYALGPGFKEVAERCEL